MIRALLLALLLLAGPALAQPSYPPGASVGLMPPPGFAPSTRFAGFARGEEASIVIVEFPPEAFDAMRTGMTADGLAQRGLKQVARREVRLPGRTRPGVLIEVDMAATGQNATRWLLLVPDPALTGFVTATVMGTPTAEQKREIEAALASVTLRPTPGPEEQRAALPFRFEDRPGLRYTRAIAGTSAQLFAPGAPIGTALSLTYPNLLIATGNGPIVPPDQLKAYAASALSNIRALRDLRIVGTPEPVSFAGQEGMLVRAVAVAGPEPGTRLMLAQWIAVKPDGGTLVVLAQASPENFEPAWPDFEAVVKSIAPK
jgi:hypothetical protein